MVLAVEAGLREMFITGREAGMSQSMAKERSAIFVTLLFQRAITTWFLQSDPMNFIS
jgi:hypothetical protein